MGFKSNQAENYNPTKHGSFEDKNGQSNRHNSKNLLISIFTLVDTAKLEKLHIQRWF
jgi:hypothetical protein